MTTGKPRPSVFLLACVYTLAIRLLPYVLMQLGVEIDPKQMLWPWNFSPALALCLFGGAMLPHKSASLAMPLLVYLASDLGIWAVTGKLDWAFYPAQGAVYGALVLCAMCGWLLRRNRSWPGIAGCSVAAPVIFFVVTNFACWIGNSLYPQTWAGLLLCYGAALEHHRNLLASTLLFSGLLFSPLGVSENATQESPRTVPAM